MIETSLMPNYYATGTVKADTWKSHANQADNWPCVDKEWRRMPEISDLRGAG
jgi:hypothetical protein